jgi:large subunit ribosomal protein L18
MKKLSTRKKRAIRSRKKIALSRGRRLVVYRSSKHIWVQLVDLTTGKTLFSENSKKLFPNSSKKTKTEKAFEVGESLAKKAVAGGVGKIVFDKGSYRFHGRVKAVAEGARKGGLRF